MALYTLNSILYTLKDKGTTYFVNLQILKGFLHKNLVIS